MIRIKPVFGLFSGVIFIFIGIIFVYKPIKMKMWISFVGFVLSMLALLAESFAIKHFLKSLDYNVYISLIPAVFYTGVVNKMVWRK